MEQISLEMSENMIGWINAQVANGRYASVDEYLCSLVLADHFEADLQSAETDITKEVN